MHDETQYRTSSMTALQCAELVSFYTWARARLTLLQIWQEVCRCAYRLRRSLSTW